MQKPKINTIVDISVAIGAELIKTGALARSEKMRSITSCSGSRRNWGRRGGL